MCPAASTRRNAALLKEQGLRYYQGLYSETGILRPGWFRLPMEEDFQDAKLVAVQLSRLQMYDFRNQYRP